MTAESPSWLKLERRVRFSDTDAAGVVHFQHILGWCHEAWEESMQRYGLTAGEIFPGSRETNPTIALPIVHCEAVFLAPLKTGDLIYILLEPKRIEPGCFEILSRFKLGDQQVAQGCLRHIAIEATSRSRCQLPDAIERWLEASSVGQINPL